MTYLKINVQDESKPFIEELLSKLGCEVTDETPKKIAGKKNHEISPTFLFGKWKNNKINPVTFRKEVWQRTK